MHELRLMDMEKRYKEKVAVEDINFCFRQGVYGLLGENGAGKTTLMRMICGVLQPTQGKVICDEMEIAQMGGAYRRLLGYLPQDFGYYPEFTAQRFLHYMAALKAIPKKRADAKSDELLEMVGLVDVRNRELEAFSGGMLRRVGIAQALLNDPEILILDEPTSGLDPKERVRFRNIISSLGKNRIVILSTHIVSDIDYIADEVLIMKAGRIVKKGTNEAIIRDNQVCVWKCIVKETEVERLNRQFIVSNLRTHEDKVELRIVAKEKPMPDAVKQEVTLEDVYLFYAQEEWERENASI